MQTGIVPGCLVISIAGRDSGKYYMVLEMCPEGTVHLVDGQAKRVAKPKKKNVKHLSFYSGPSPGIDRKMTAGLRITDMDVRRELQDVDTTDSKEEITTVP